MVYGEREVDTVSVHLLCFYIGGDAQQEIFIISKVQMIMATVSSMIDLFKM